MRVTNPDCWGRAVKVPCGFYIPLRNSTCMLRDEDVHATRVPCMMAESFREHDLNASQDSLPTDVSLTRTYKVMMKIVTYLLNMKFQK